MSSTAEIPARTPRTALVLAAILLAAELAGIGLIFKHVIDFDCRANWSLRLCLIGSGTLVSLYCVLGAAFLFVMLNPQPFRELIRRAGERPWPLALNAAGVALALMPVAFLHGGSGASTLIPSFAFWTSGMTVMLAGLMLYLAPLPRWRAFLADSWTTLLPVVVAGALTPWLATLIRPLWRLDAIAEVTFQAVAWSVGQLGFAVAIDPYRKIIGSEDFAISVAPVCSGIEGIALVTLFVTLYLVLFRHELRFPRAFLLYPVGIAASALFNAVRITLLLAIGLKGNPELAAGGFHSHAGWLMFTLVALGIIALAQGVPALKRVPAGPGTGSVPAGNGAPPLSFWRDPVVAKILPFAVFMLSALAVSTLSQSPGMLYPARVLALGAVVLVFLPIYARLSWALDPVALAAGAAIGAMWVLIPVADTGTAAPYGTLAGGLLLLWFVARGFGTIVLVPLVEELFFRDYLESRLRLGHGAAWAIFAVLVTATLFAALHDRWAEAFLAGLVFSAVARRRNRIADAILAHAVANAIVYAAALITGNLNII